MLSLAHQYLNTQHFFYSKTNHNLHQNACVGLFWISLFIVGVINYYLHPTFVAQKGNITSLKNKSNMICWSHAFPYLSKIWSIALLFLENIWQTCSKIVQLHVWRCNWTPSHAQLYCSSAKFVICFPGHWLFDALYLCYSKANGQVHWKTILLYVKRCLVDRM